MEKREGKVKDLVVKLQRGEITIKEAKEEMHRRGLSEQESLKWIIYSGIVWVTYFVLWLPLSSKFSAQLPTISFPAIVIYISAFLLALGTFVMVWMHRSHCKKGGLKESGETVIFYNEGPYKIMRHPGAFGFMAWFILLPVILSAYAPFTLFTFAAILMMCIHVYHMAYVEEKFNVMKWGDEYRQYMKDVPRFNFIKGLWNLREKR